MSTYDHRLRKTGHPVRSAIHKPQIGGLVVGSVTTSESPLLYVFCPTHFLFLYLFVCLFFLFYLFTAPFLCSRFANLISRHFNAISLIILFTLFS
ncbi:hypothetical protein L228DRAFT_138196 [Xylona heveae TC161]|uniref:Uncharacterized protein n=1 Tax=Xylona heveae (strain CBS 132557 / TC161) TaxID=1328760 RepID=A0A165H1K2_XYLHT|nr:hypothetical protein L228DRAFT_138196 [Xylona heveae TC161]KZF22868.1 hypothetical protein L228DRAFT_138196 [Xylona heveae TC161]